MLLPLAEIRLLPVPFPENPKHRLTRCNLSLSIAGNLIPALIALGHPGFVPKPWHGYLFVVALCTVCFLINGYLAKHLPLLEGFVLCITIMAFVSIVIVLLVLSPKQTASEVFQTFTPESELGTPGMLRLIASQVLLVYSLVASDSTAHMAEETQHAASVIPRAMVWSYFIIGLRTYTNGQQGDTLRDNYVPSYIQ